MSGTDFYYAPQATLAQKLAESAPGSSPKRVFFTNSGAESVEAALKLARYYTKRQNVIAFFGAFHGRTMGALSLTGSKAIQKRGFGPLIPGVTHIDYPNPYRCPTGITPEEQGMQCIDHLEDIIFRKTLPPDEIAAIFVEPIQGEGGYIVPPEGFLKRLKTLTEKHGILFVADEVQSGMGRTGKMFAIEHWEGIEPDIICLAKGLASGMPLGAIVAKESVMNWPPGAHASTFGGNPVSCVAALETIALLEEELIDNTQQIGAELFQGLRELQKKHRLIGDVRGKGLMLCIELVGDRESKVPAIVERDELVLSCFHKGLLLLGCGENSIRFSPPLVVDSEQVKTALSILDESLTEIEETS
jgi:4-aminobutyrate aminotransferase